LKAAQAEEHGREDELFKVYTERAWPVCDIIVGNPPFLGGKLLRRELGDAYVGALFENFAGRVRPEADLCCYWFEKARQQIEEGHGQRAGLLATQGIRGGANRDVLKRIKESGGIFFAESDRDWILGGANVHVSMVAFDNGAETRRTLDGKTVPEIHANLAASAADITTARRLARNLEIAFMGDTKGGSFDIGEERALEMLREPNPHGRPNSDVILPWVNGLDVTRRPRGMFIIDFGLTRTEEDCAKYAAPFAHVQERVRPERLGNKRALYARHWWRHVEPRPGMLAALAPLPRFLVTARVTKHRLFVWYEAPTLPDSAVFAFALADDFSFGVLQSRIHEAWARANGTQVRERESGFRYTPTSCFETFPLPFADDLARDKDDPAQTVAKFRAAHYHTEQSNVLREDSPPTSPAEHREAIATAARELNEMRENWLNPPEWTIPRPLTFPGALDGPWHRFVRDADARGIGTVHYPLTEPRDAECAARLARRTLTNLYNEHPAWLDNAHAKLDAAVAAAYGWPAALADDEILARLLELNLTRAAEETKLANSKPPKAQRSKGAGELL
jgi:type II restriction/modification system DNA methylase subunit YeeA